MREPPTHQAEARTTLSRDRVLAAAIDLADAEGLEALSMRRLARSLGVEAMTLYYHVDNKAALLDAMAEAVVGEIDLALDDAAWKATLRRIALSAYDAFSRHAWAAGLVLAGSGEGDGRVRYMEAILGTLRRAGFSVREADHAYHALESHIMGFTLWLAGMNLGPPEELAAKAGPFLETLDHGAYPYLVEHVHHHLAPTDPDDEGSFAFGLDLILDGIERLR